jgi:hypothetical protein
MRSTDSTRKPSVRLLYSVTIIAAPSGAPAGARPRMTPSDSTGITLPRSEIRPSTPGGMLGVRVMKGVRDTSRTLKTLMPKFSPVPSENSRISMRFEPASVARPSTASNRADSS